MDGKTSGSRTRSYVKILTVTNVVTLVALIVIFIRQPAPLPSLEKMEEMVEAQDWLIGEISEDWVQLFVENAKLEFGKAPSESRSDLEKHLKGYETSRAEWDRDLDSSRARLEAEYQEKYPEQAESDIPESTGDTDFVR